MILMVTQLVDSIRTLFPGVEIAEFAPNIVAESVYAQCDVDGNGYLLLESFIDHRTNDSALSVCIKK